MTEKEYSICIGKILAGKALEHDEAMYFVEILFSLESMLDESDADDFFGTEGWRHNIGWE